MKLFLLSVIACILTGCATPPTWLANMYDSQDSCQLKNNGGNFPSYCGGGSRTYIYVKPNETAPLGAPLGYIKK